MHTHNDLWPHWQAYPGEELLIVYDHDFQYGENFYICITEEAKERILNVIFVYTALNH